MQDRFYEQISEKHGLGRGEKGSTKEHKTKAQWEMQQLEEQRKTMVQELARKGQELLEIDKLIESHSKKEKAAKVKIERLDGNFKGRVLSARELDAIKPQATLPGGIGLYRVDQINELKKTSYAAIRYKERCVDLDKRYKTVEAENARLRPKMNFRERLAENRELSKEQLELHQLRAVKEQIPKPIWESAAAQAAALSRSISHSHGPSR
jgi:predicted  nucleic acid-binding Zn-ribbon protein